MSNVVVRGNMTAMQINDLKPQPRELALNTSGGNTLIPIIYGRNLVPGIRPIDIPYGGDFYSLIVWGMGEVQNIEIALADGSPLPSSIQARHYRGTLYQGVDPWLAAAIPLYDDDLILRKPAGDIGVAYSVFKSSSSFTSVPGFQAIVRGKVLFDPDSASDGDPFRDRVGFSVHVTGTNGDTSATDTSTNAHTVTFHGDAEIQSNQLDLDGTGDYVHIADDVSVEFGDKQWTFESRCRPSSVSGTAVIASKSAAGQLCFALYRSGADLKLSLSSNGSAYDILNAVTVQASCFSNGVEADTKVEFTGTEYVVQVDGDEVYRFYSTDMLHNSTANWTIGADSAGSFGWTGKIRCARFTKLRMRYGAPTAITNSPFSDSGTFTPGYVYSDNPALCFGDLATSRLYGMGVSVSGLSESKAWCDDLVDGVARARVSLVIAQPQPTQTYLDLLATYADLLWVHEGSDIRMIPRRPVTEDNPQSLELVPYGDFADDEGWSITGDWSIAGGVLS